MSLDIEHLRGWVGRTEAMDALATLAPLHGLTATLDRDDPPRVGDALPPCWHWLYFFRCTASPGSGPTATPGAAASFPPWRCRAGCGPAARSNSARRCMR